MSPITDGYAQLSDLTTAEARQLKVAQDLQDGMRWRVRDVLPSQTTAQSHGSSLRQEFS